MRKGLSQRQIDLPNIGESLEEAHKYRVDRQKAYQEGYKEFEDMALPVALNGIPFRYHPNINFYVDMAGACNCNCRFCIAKVCFNRNTKPRKDIENVLGQAIDLLSPMNPSIQITGGEPTLFADTLINLFRVINQRKVWKSVLNTNGYDLGSVTDAILKYNIDHTDLSRHHYNDDLNWHIMDGGVSSSMLRECIKPIRDRVRVQCNLIGTYIDTYGEVMQFIAYAYHKLGVTNLAFAALTPLPEADYYDDSIIKYVNNRPVDIDSILAQVDKDSRFYFEKYRGGVACYYEVWKFTAYEKPMTILFKYSDNHWLKKADDDPVLLPDVVLHTDGTLAGSWCRSKKLIHKY